MVTDIRECYTGCVKGVNSRMTQLISSAKKKITFGSRERILSVLSLPDNEISHVATIPPVTQIQIILKSSLQYAISSTVTHVLSTTKMECVLAFKKQVQFKISA